MGGGHARPEHIANISCKTLRPILLTQINRKSTLRTDTASGYMQVGKEFARHETVDHGKDEYVRGDADSNTVADHFSILKRSVTGTFHHVSEAHLHRHLAAFDFRHSRRASLDWSDAERVYAIAEGIEDNASPIDGFTKPVTNRQKAKKAFRLLQCR